MVHHFSGDDCSLQNLVFVPIDIVNEHLPNTVAETQLKLEQTLWIKKCAPSNHGGMNYLEIDTEIRTGTA